MAKFDHNKSINAAALKSGVKAEQIAAVVNAPPVPPAPVAPDPVAPVSPVTPAPEPLKSGSAVHSVPPAVPDDTGLPSFLAPQPAAPVPAPVTASPAEPLPTGDAERNFAALRKKLETAESDRITLRQKVEELSKRTVVSADMETLQKERDDALNRLARYDLANDPRFVAKYSLEEQTARLAINRIAKEYGANDADVQKALGMPLKERMKFFQDNLPDAVPLVAPHLARLDDLQVRKDMELQNASSVKEEMDKQNMVVREKAIEEARAALHSQVVRELADAGYYVFQVKVGDEEWNNGVQEMRQRVRDLLATGDVLAQARAFAQGAAAPVLLAHVRLLDKENAKLRQTLQLLRGASPTINAQGPGSADAPTVDTSSLDAKSAAKLLTNTVIRGR